MACPDFEPTAIRRPPRLTRTSTLRATLLLALLLQLIAALPSWSQSVPAVPVPNENPITEAKRILGKILFWDEQLSSDNTVACGTCHATDFAGGERSLAVHPGADGIFDTNDDVLGSAGVVRRNQDNEPIEDPVFGFDPQVTGRAAPNFFAGIWAEESFWDGRAGTAFIDPEDGQTIVAAANAALESQAVDPILSSVEMAKDGRTWDDVRNKLAASLPLEFAAELPADLSAALASGSSYGELFAAAFGDSAITAARIGMAIATYERTLVADQTPWDAFEAGDATALTATQQSGWSFFQGSDCAECHEPPLFSDDTFRNIGVRDPSEDLGRAEVTGDPDDDGRFKVPTLRNVALKASFLHTGELATLQDVLRFYGPDNQGSTVNVDALLPVRVSPTEREALVDFLSVGLLDPRVAAASFPFDQPTLSAAGAILVPEPSAAAMLLASLTTLQWLARRRARRAHASSATSSRPARVD